MTSKPTTSQLIADMNVQIALVHAQNAEKDDARLEAIADLDAEIALEQEEQTRTINRITESVERGKRMEQKERDQFFSTELPRGWGRI